MKKELYEAEMRLCQADAGLKYQLIRFGDHLAAREGYKAHQGLDALHYYLISKHHWLPAEVFALSDNHLRFLFAEEISGWTLPKDARI